MQKSIAVTRDQVAPLAACTFPAYAGRKFKVIPCTTVTFIDLNWSGGSRSQYVACTLSGERLGDMSAHNMRAPWNNPAEGGTIDIPPGCVIVQHSIFCGRDMGLTFHIRPEDMPAWLPKEFELGPVERLVLFYTATRKSSYNGKDRYEMAASDAGYSHDVDRLLAGALFPSRPAWVEARASLTAQGLLNARGAITVDGRNAVNALR